MLNAKTGLAETILVFVALVSSVVGAEPRPTPTPREGSITIIEGGKEMPFLARTDKSPDGRTILRLHKNQVVEFVLPPGTQLQPVPSDAGKESSYQIVNGNILVGLRAGTNSLLQVGRDLVAVYVTADEEDQIDVVPTFLSHKIIADGFGRGIAKYFLVVQVNIRNNSPDKQYLLRNVSVKFDPQQCRVMERFYKDTGYEENFDEDVCMEVYQHFFDFPTAIGQIERENIMGVADVEKYRSKRFMLFKAMGFVGALGSGLAGFNLFGSDGIKAFAYLQGGFKDAVDAALPKVAEEKYARLARSIPEQNVLISNNNFKTVNIFIPADLIFSERAWELYKRPFHQEDASERCIDRAAGQRTKGGQSGSDGLQPCLDSTSFRRYMKLFLSATADGILIDNNTRPKTSTGTGTAVAIDESRTP